MTGNNENNEARRTRLKKLEEKLAEFIADESPEMLASDLASLAIALLARKYPADLSAADRKKIKDNFPDATDALMAERSLSSEGLAVAVALAAQMGEIAIDYSPLSHSKPSFDNDQKHQTVIREILEPQVSAAYNEAVTGGLSPYGASTMLIVLGMFNGLKHGVTWAAIARPLFESVGVAMTRGAELEVPADVEERAIQAVMAQMGISRKEAKRYAEAAKKMRRESL